MTVRGSTQTLTGTFRATPGGTLVDVTGLTLTIMLDGVDVLGPLSPPTVLHDATGLYRYEWVIPGNATVGTYIAVWSATIPGDSTPTVGYTPIEVTEFVVADVPDFGGCPWPMDPACATDQWNAYPESIKERALAFASAALQRLVGNRVSNCPVTIRPCMTSTAYRYGYQPWYSPFATFTPVNWNGTWVNAACQPLTCLTSCEVSLPGPVGRLDQVKVDGVALNLADLRVDNGRFLVWQGTGDCPWNFFQDLSLPDTEDNTFSVTYLNAHPVDGLGAYAVGVLALEFAKACDDGEDCELPAGVTTVVRQGLSIDVVTGAFPGGQTGLRVVDQFIYLWNPKHLTQAPTVWSPDSTTPRIRTL